MPRCDAAQRRMFAARPITRFLPSGPTSCPTPGCRRAAGASPGSAPNATVVSGAPVKGG